ncbi:hypothetical protein, partial [Microbulbifer sp. 2205BS26-8]|uniref:hypothetical protein n=1 Tax=Microbulbifer sp. 2205BS26-8 TaxID=3064386 RepID=UPI00273F4B80
RILHGQLHTAAFYAFGLSGTGAADFCWQFILFEQVLFDPGCAGHNFPLPRYLSVPGAALQDSTSVPNG